MKKLIFILILILILFKINILLAQNFALSWYKETVDGPPTNCIASWQDIGNRTNIPTGWDFITNRTGLSFYLAFSATNFIAWDTTNSAAILASQETNKLTQINKIIRAGSFTVALPDTSKNIRFPLPMPSTNYITIFQVNGLALSLRSTNHVAEGFVAILTGSAAGTVNYIAIEK